MMKLHTFAPAFGLRNVSPFCLKVEMALVHLNLPFEIVETPDPRKAPKGKLPYVEIDGEILPDSEIILEMLDNKTQGGLYGHLAPDAKGQGYAFTRLAEDHLYWMGVASRWLDDQWFPNIIDGFFGIAPPLIRGFVARGAQKQMRRTYDLQGLGRHTPEEQKDFARRDLAALAGVVEARQYLVGDRLSGFDFTVASMLAGFLDNTPATWLTEVAREHPPLVEYAERVQKETGVYGREVI